MKWTEAKRQGLCTKCFVRPATGLRKILCDTCRSALARQHEQNAESTEYFKRDYSGDRG